MASWWQKSLLAATGITSQVAGSYSTFSQRSPSSKKGKLHLSGLHEAVEIITDRYGIPHIYAQNEDDLYFAQGYMHAQDRLWQLEINRRLGSGRLSEIFGEVALETDRFCRRLGMHRSAEEEITRLDPHNKRVLEAYTRGINTYISTTSHKLPIEFTILRFKPAPWRPADTIQWGKMMGWNLGGNWETELIRAQLIAKLGPERASQLEAGYDPNHPLIIPPGVDYQGINAGLLEQYHQVKELSGFSLLGGSNNWVVDGTMTTSGSPMLCNDPHLGQAIPSIWYECHLVAGDIDVVGVSFPGSPGIIIGHNQDIAWGVTNAVSDVQDLYIEKFHPTQPDYYEFMGQWLQATMIREEITVKGHKNPVIEEVRVTRHGPILTTMSTQSGELPLALRWTGLEGARLLNAIQHINRASNWHEFRNALRDWDVPAQNFVYADRGGNIGYIMAGAIPLRARGQALLPSPGWTGEYEWTGLIPFEELPQTYNPSQHFIVTANNRVVDDSYPYYITHEWLNGYRAQRIRDLLTTKGKLSPLDMALIQSDYYAIPAEAIVPSLLKAEPHTALEQQALAILSAWDYVLAPESVGASLYTLCLRTLESIVLGVILGDDESLFKQYLGVGSTILASSNGYFTRSKPLLIRLLKVLDDAWFTQSAIPNGPRTWQEAIQAAFQATINELQERFGNDILTWHYGRIHRMTYNHPLGAVKILENFFNRGPYPIGGDSDTVNVASSLPNNPEVVTTVPSFRLIVDLAHIEHALAIHAPGQSGQPGSKHYDDFIPLWRKIRHHPMLVTRDLIEEAEEKRLHLVPK
jgi:penicillin amidase